MQLPSPVETIGFDFFFFVHDCLSAQILHLQRFVEIVLQCFTATGA